MTSIFNYKVEEGDKKNAVKIALAVFAVLVVIICMGYASYWSFMQTTYFLVPAFDKFYEAVVFAVIIQYGPQPALFFVAVFMNRWQKSRVELKNKGRNVKFADYMELWLNFAYMVIAAAFFLGLSGIDFMTNKGQLEADRKTRQEIGQDWVPLLWYTMNAFAFFVLWFEEIIGNLFVYLFVQLEEMSKIMGWDKSDGFFNSAQGFFRKLSGRSTPSQPSRNYRTSQEQTLQRSATSRASSVRGSGEPIPKPVAGRHFDDEPNYHSVNMSSFNMTDDDELDGLTTVQRSMFKDTEYRA